jgi:hypothetical protein
LIVLDWLQLLICRWGWLPMTELAMALSFMVRRWCECYWGLLPWFVVIILWCFQLQKEVLKEVRKARQRRSALESKEGCRQWWCRQRQHAKMSKSKVKEEKIMKKPKMAFGENVK